MNLFKLIREFSKKYGRSPSPSELDKLKKMAQEIESAEKVIPFPQGGKDKTDFFSTRPDPRVKQPKGAKMDVQRAHENISGGSGYADGDTKYNADVLGEEIARMRGLIDEGQDATDMDPKAYSKIYEEAYSYLTELRMLNRKPKKGGLMSTIEGETKMRSPEEIMNFLMKSGKGKDTGIGTAPKTTKPKPDVDPVLQQSEDQKQMFQDFSKRTETDAEIIARMNKQNKDAVKRLKEKKEKDLADKLKDYDGDPDAMAMGGRIGFNRGSGPGKGIMNFIKKLSEKSPAQRYKDYLASVKKRSIEGDFKSLAPELGAISGGGILVNRKMKRILEEGNEQQKERFLQEYIEELNNDPSYKDRPELRDKLIANYTESLFGEKRAMGGRIGFDKGSPPSKGRRNFLKLMGGLASIPIFGKLFKAAKPAAKVAKTVEQTTSGVPAYFPKLVEKIKMLGDDVTEIAATKERQKVTKYKGYELTEEIDTGKKEIKLGDAEYGSEEYMIYDPPETIIGKNNKPVEVPAQYDEVTVKPDMDGKMKDVDVGLDSIDQIMKDADMIETNYKMKPDGRPKKSGGGVAYMLGE
jgi:hypothetical protein